MMILKHRVYLGSHPEHAHGFEFTDRERWGFYMESLSTTDQSAIDYITLLCHKAGYRDKPTQPTIRIVRTAKREPKAPVVFIT